MLVVSDLLPRIYKVKIEKIFSKDNIFYFNADRDVLSGKNVYDSILHHPDIYFFMADKNTMIHSPNMSSKILKYFKNLGITLLVGDRAPSGSYPETVLYNSVRVGNTVICNSEYTDKDILEYVKQHNLRCVTVKQGYVRCSVIQVDDNAIITSDMGIKNIVEQSGMEVLYVNPDEIILKGEKHGFIGGAAGKIGDKEILFLGDPCLYQEYERVMSFIRGKGIKPTILPDLPLIDTGGVFSLKI